MKSAVLVILGLAALASAQSGLPTIAIDWSALVIQSVGINQGGTKQPDGSICCGATVPECKVQTIFQAGLQYFSVSTNRTAFKNPDGSGIVTLYNDQKEYQVDSNGVCQAYCPLPEDDNELFPIGFPSGAVNKGKVNYQGQMLTDIYWDEQIPILNITMEVDNFYIDTTNWNDSIPVAQIQELTPFGQQIGGQNTTWANFKAGPQPSSAFTVLNKTTCQMSNNCGGSSSSSSPSSSSDDFPGFAERATIRLVEGRDSALAAQVIQQSQRTVSQLNAALQQLDLTVEDLLDMLPASMDRALAETVLLGATE